MSKSSRSKTSVLRVLRAIEAAHVAFPEQRVGQIIANALVVDLFYVENDTLALLIEKYAASREVEP